MANASSTIRVNIIGDAKDLQAASKDANKAIGGIGKAAKGLGAALVAGFAVDAALDFGQTALDEADRLGDASARLTAQLGPLAPALIDSAGGLERLGQSRGDALEMEARFTDLGIAAHLSASQVAEAAPSVAEAASALALLGKGGGDAPTIIDAIGKAAAGSTKPLKDLGIDLSEADVKAQALKDTGKKSAGSLTDNELAAARLHLIMLKLAPQIDAVTGSSADLETKQSILQAKFETLTGRIGQALEGPLNSLLDWILQGIDGLGMLSEFFALVDQKIREGLTPIARMADALRTLLGLIGDALTELGKLVGLNGNVRVAANGGRIVGSPSNVTVTVQGGSPEVVQQAVQQAIIHAQNTGNLP